VTTIKMIESETFNMNRSS